ncbi:MAG: T9SS type A sorting domain-containing protein [Candidatus Stahlbacteria bacterium]|nr:MAG: T9SS type A sorting domain-containing protein [Candidatus Stahlbacteria bacterium]
MRNIILHVIFIIIITLPNHLFAIPWQRDSAYLNIKINNDTTTEVQNEEQIVMNPNDTTNLVAVWRDFRVGYRQVAYAYSFDGGLTWGQDLFVEPEYIWDSDPGITVDTAGNFYAVILSFNSTSEPNGLFVYKSTDGGVTWSDPVTVINGVPGVFEDKELIACDRSGGPYTDNLYVVWTRFYSTQILMCRSTDEGNSFVGPVTISDMNGVQWPVPCVGPNSEVYVAWVQYSPGAIRFDCSTDGGETFGTDITIQNVSFVSGYIYGDIMVFSFPAIDVDITGGPYNGNIYVAYMDYASGNTDTDIYFTCSTDGGNSWSQKIRINDDPLNNGCDQFHPWLFVAPDGNIIVVFLDRRLDSGNLLMDLYMTTSTDGGNSWSSNERITTVSSDPTAGSVFSTSNQPLNKFPIKINHPVILTGRAGLIGEYIGVTASSINDIHPIWTDTRFDNQDVFVGVKDTSSYVQEYSSDNINDGVLSVVPNPAQNKIIINIKMQQNRILSSTTTLKIFDTSGRIVKTFRESQNQIIWRRYNDKGVYVGKGVYFCCLETNNLFVIKKFILL